MEGVHGMQESETASVMKVAREPAIIINGVPDLPPDCSSGSQPEVRDAAESQVDPRFGEWLEGRKVRKLFGDKYYVGKVVMYDSQSNWYNVIYEDGDQEDLEWHELEEILLPLDITIPLKALVMYKCKLQNTGPEKRKVGRPRKVYAIMEGNMNKTSDMVPISRGSDAMSNQMMSGAAKGENTQVCLNASNQPRKRAGLERIELCPVIIELCPVISNLKKRGRPPKNRSASGNPLSAGSTPSSLALVSVQDASVATDMQATDMQEASRIQNSVHKCTTQTAKAEKLKREKLRVQGAPPGTQLF